MSVSAQTLRSAQQPYVVLEAAGPRAVIPHLHDSPGFYSPRSVSLLGNYVLLRRQSTHFMSLPLQRMRRWEVEADRVLSPEPIPSTPTVLRYIFHLPVSQTFRLFHCLFPFILETTSCHSHLKNLNLFLSSVSLSF